MAGYKGLLTGTHLVLSKRVNLNDVGPPEYSPDIFFTLYIPPTSLDVSWRSPHVVKALFASVHVDSGNFRLGDLEVSLIQGVKRALYSTRQGGTAILSGKERASELRAFLRRCSEAIRDKTHRMEFHSDARGFHFEVVPQGPQSHRISNADSSRVGGALSTLSFVIVDDLDTSTNPLATVEELIGSVGRSLSSLLGETTYAVAVVEQGLTTAEKGIGVLTNFVADSRVMIQRVGEVINGVERIQAAPINLLRDLNDTLDTLRRDVINPTSNRSTSERLKRLGEEYDRLLRVLTETAKDTRRGSFAGSNTLHNTDQSGLTTIQSALTASGDSLAPLLADSLGQSTGGAFKGLPGRMSGYSGWLPYSVTKGDTLQDIANQAYGTPDYWMEIAIVNGMDGNNDLIAGDLIQIPVVNGGFSFSISGYDGHQAVKDSLEEAAFFTDIKVERIGGSNRWVMNDTKDDIVTVTGPDNYKQRFDNIVFQTELGENPEFRNVGIYMGIGEARVKEVIGLTQLTSRQQLVADPRTLSVKTLWRDIGNTGDTVDIRYEVETVSKQIQLSLEVLGGLL